MASSSIKKQVANYLPLLSEQQQVLVLDMIKGFLNVDKDSGRVTRKQYNKEVDTAANRVEEGNAVSHDVAKKELAKW